MMPCRSDFDLVLSFCLVEVGIFALIHKLNINKDHISICNPVRCGGVDCRGLEKCFYTFVLLKKITCNA